MRAEARRGVDMKIKGQEEIEIKKGQKRNRRKGGIVKWILLATVLILITFLSVGYVNVAKSYRTRFLPASMVNGLDCGDMDAAEVSARLTPSVDDYVLEVRGKDFVTGESGAVLGRITASDVNMRYDGVLASVENALAEQNEYEWILTYLTDKTASYSVTLTMSYDEEKAKSFVQTWDAFQVENMRAAQSAHISEYSEKTNSYQVIPKTISTKINEEQAYQYIIDSLHSHKTELDLEALGCYEEISEEAREAKLNDTVGILNKWLGASVTYDWNGSKVVLDKEQLRNWISIVEDEPVLDKDQVRDFVKKQAAKYDTYQTNAKFTTIHGVTMTLHRASYGWKTDINAETEALIQLIEQGGNASKEPAYSVMARKKGTNDIGDSYVEADLTHQHLYLHINGQVVLETDFVSGDMSNGSETPQGIFGITYKTTNVVLRGADYESPVSYWMPYFGNYGMHDATWRDVFGGDIYLTDGSHGCINLPLDMAEVIYLYMSKGFPVVCYYYEIDPLAGLQVPPASPELPGAGQDTGNGQNSGGEQGAGVWQNAGGEQGIASGQNDGGE